MHPARMIAAATLLILAGPALAHPGHEAGVAGGLLHPLSGADHLLAMIAVGLFAGIRGGRATWAWPLAFLAFAGFGFFAGPGALPLAEPMVLASVLILGLLVAAAAPIRLGTGVALVALFGFCHGQAHAAEAGTQALAGFAAGFLVTSAALHGAGLGLQRLAGNGWGRVAGAATLAGGLALALA